MSEVERIRTEYERRTREVPADFYSLARPVNLFFAQSRVRCALAELAAAGCETFAGKLILEVGCGAGGWLPDFEAWGAERGHLAGVDLDEGRIAAARRRLCAERDGSGREVSPGADLRVGDAARLPWPEAHFDLVVQSTVFTSILDAGLRRAVAAEMRRVLKPGGLVLWYDFFYDNPRNPNVRAVGRRELRELFPGCALRLRRITLAPPLARRLVPWTGLGARLLEELRVLNTHYLAVLRKP